jgi:hypothetical protein
VIAPQNARTAPLLPTSDTMSAAPVPVVVSRQEQGKGQQGLRLADDEQNRTFTRVERKVLEAITSPDLANATNEERYAHAGVGKTRFYAIMQDPWFRRKHREFIYNHVQARIAELVNASANTATTPGRDGFNDRKMLLEMTGHYVPRQQIDHTTAGQPIVGVVGVAMDQV